jgi:hypothetical protein
VNLLVWIVCLSAPSFASSTGGAIKGVVVDEACWGLAGARLTLQGRAGGPQVVTTDWGGRFRLDELWPGSYELLAEMEGFGPVRRTGTEVLIGRVNSVIVEMRPGATPVEVVGERLTMISEDAEGTVACPLIRHRALPDPGPLEPIPLGSHPAASAEGQATPSAVPASSTAPPAAPVRYRIAIDSAAPIRRAELVCGGWSGSRAVVGDDIVVEFYPPPGMCTLTVHGTGSQSTDVTVPADWGDVVCFVSTQALSCL